MIFPRQTCRGLIEAGLSAARPARRPAPFPGKLAGASLKLRWWLRLAEIEAPFPGKLAGASLKLWSQIPWWFSGPAFPGKLAGASLKRPCGRARGRRARSSFPGKLAGASLKPELADLRELVGELSPANLPGPH